MKQPSFQMSADARLIYQRLKRAAIGETVALAEIEASVSRPIGEIRGALATALRRSLKDDGMVFANVRSVGYRRCGDVEITDSAVGDTDRLRRRARRTVEKLTKVQDFAAMPAEKQLEHTTRLSLMAAISTMTRAPAVDRLRQAAQGRAGQLPLSDTVQAFLGRARSGEAA